MLTATEPQAAQTTETPMPFNAKRYTGPSLLVENRPRYVCLDDNCHDAEIPASSVTSKMNAATGVRTVTATCPRCLTRYELDYVLRYGAWQMDGDVRQIPAPRANPFVETYRGMPTIAVQAGETANRAVYNAQGYDLAAVVSDEERKALADDDTVILDAITDPATPIDPASVDRINTDCDAPAAGIADGGTITVEAFEEAEPEKSDEFDKDDYLDLPQPGKVWDAGRSPLAEPERTLDVSTSQLV